MTRDRSWRRCLPFDDWPPADKAAWHRAIAKGDILDGQGPAAHWAAATKRTNIQHYSRWLGYLQHIGRLDRGCRPEERVATEVVRRYVAHLGAEVAPRTVVSTLVGLKVMMKAMAPDANWRWLADVCNALNRWAKPQKDKASRMRPTEEIYAAAVAELRWLLTTPVTRRIERVAFRDRLMVAMLAPRPIRLKNFSNIRIGHELRREGRHWVLVIPGEEVKNGQPLEHALPTSLVPFLHVYLDRIRPSFLKDRQSQALWLTFEGDTLGYNSIYGRFILVTKRLFGVPINPHLLRDCAATSLSTVSPAAALSAGALLGHRTFATTERYYVRANRLEANRAVNDILASIKTSRK